MEYYEREQTSSYPPEVTELLLKFIKKTSDLKGMATICDISTKPILTEEEACIFLGITRNTIYDLRVTGKIGFCKGKGQKKPSIRYKREHLLEYIGKNYEEIKPIKLKYQS